MFKVGSLISKAAFHVFFLALISLSAFGEGIGDGIAACKSGKPFEGERIFRKLALAGNSSAQLYLGALLLSQGPQGYKEALEWHRMSAQQGNVDAQVQLGLLYSLGIACKKDLQESLRWYTLAAKRGNTSAQRILGEVYELGNQIPQNFAEAAKWYCLAAKNGDVHAQFALGCLYRDGRGVEQSKEKAFFWFTIAADEQRAFEKEREKISSKLSLMKRAKIEAQCNRWKAKFCPKDSLGRPNIEKGPASQPVPLDLR